MTACVYCTSTRLTRAGREARSGRQKWLCNWCLRGFTEGAMARGDRGRTDAEESVVILWAAS